MLKIKTIMDELKISLVLPCAKALKAFVIFDFSVSLTSMSSLLANILNREGNKENVTIIEIVRPSVIIQPKSIIGLMPLKIKDKKAQIVVKTV